MGQVKKMGYQELIYQYLWDRRWRWMKRDKLFNDYCYWLVVHKFGVPFVVEIPLETHDDFSQETSPFKNMGWVFTSWNSRIIINSVYPPPDTNIAPRWQAFSRWQPWISLVAGSLINYRCWRNWQMTHRLDVYRTRCKSWWILRYKTQLVV